MAKILFVDDSVTMHRAVALSLKRESHELICVDNGDDALRLAREVRPQIIISDLEMPGMTGIELCKKIKSDPVLRNIKFVLMCGSFDQVDEGRLQGLPTDGRLWKPFESHTLIALLTTLVKQGAESVRHAATETAQDLMENMTQETFRVAEKTGEFELPPRDEVEIPPMAQLPADFERTGEIPRSVMNDLKESGLKEYEVPVREVDEETLPPFGDDASVSEESAVLTHVEDLWGASPQQSARETEEKTAPPVHNEFSDSSSKVSLSSGPREVEIEIDDWLADTDLASFRESGTASPPLSESDLALTSDSTDSPVDDTRGGTTSSSSTSEPTRADDPFIRQMISAGNASQKMPSLETADLPRGSPVISEEIRRIVREELRAVIATELKAELRAQLSEQLNQVLSELDRL